MCRTSVALFLPFTELCIVKIYHDAHRQTYAHDVHRHTYAQNRFLEPSAESWSQFVYKSVCAHACASFTERVPDETVSVAISVICY